MHQLIDKTYTSVNCLIDKMKEHTKEDILECKLCNFEFSKKSQLMQHIKEHGQQVDSIGDVFSNFKIWMC